MLFSRAPLCGARPMARNMKKAANPWCAEHMGQNHRCGRRRLGQYRRRTVDAAGKVISMGADFFWTAAKEIAPAWIIDVIQGIREKGIVGYLRDKLTGAFNGIFGGLSSGDGSIAVDMQHFADFSVPHVRS